MSDPISDMLTRFRNAQAVHKPWVLLPYSKIKFDLAKILEKEGYVGEVDVDRSQAFPMLRVALKYNNRQGAIHSIRRVSTPGHRVYAKTTELPRVLSGLGCAVVSTPNGLMTNIEARRRKLGGEILCEVS